MKPTPLGSKPPPFLASLIASSFAIQLARLIFESIKDVVNVDLKVENSNQLKQATTLLQSTMISSSDKNTLTGLLDSCFSFTFRRSQSNSRITILNIPQYEWFSNNKERIVKRVDKRLKTFNTTDAVEPFFNIADIEQCQHAFLVGILGETPYRHEEARAFLQYYQQWDRIQGRFSVFVNKTIENRQTAEGMFQLFAC